MKTENNRPSPASDPKVEEHAIGSFRSERIEDVVAIALAAILVLAVLAGLRI